MNTVVSDIQNSNVDLLQSMFRSNHQLGVIARFASEIAKVTNTEELTKLTQSALVDFGLSGFFKITASDSKYLKHFGNSIKRDVFTSIECLQYCAEKICAKDNFILFRLSHFIMVLDATTLSKEQIDETKDNLAIFSDIIDAWVINFIKVQNLQENIGQYKDELVKKIDLVCHNILGFNDEIKSKHHKLSQELLLQLSARFPTLGLELDQEDEILNNVESTTRSYGSLTDEQVANNTEIIQLLNDTVEFLLQQTEAENDSAQEDGQTISNEDNIVLF